MSFSKLWIDTILRNETANCSAGLIGYESPPTGQTFADKYYKKNKKEGKKNEQRGIQKNLS